MANNNEQALGEDQTLAHLLEFLSKLQQSHVKTKVITEIKEKVKGYVKDYDQQFGNPTTGYLFETIKKSSELRSNIVVSDQNYKHYETAFDEDNSIEAKKYAKHLINNVFPLLGCLYYMYYECSQEGYYIEGGEWSNEKCDGTSGGQHLKNWLTTDSGTDHMIQRGFQEGELSKNSGQTLFPAGSQKTKNLLYYDVGAQLQVALYYMLFLPTPDKWNDAQSGHAVLFLQAFCKMTSGGQLKDTFVDNNGTFKQACKDVTDKMTKLIQSKTIVPVAWRDTVKYETLLEATHFWDYIDWLKQNLQKLVTSLEEMAKDVPKWKDKESLKASQTHGPFPWGFVFKDPNWTSGGGLQQKLKDPLSELTKALETVKDVIDNVKPIPSSSTASTLGGVAGGLGAVGAAGAAAAYSGVLGPVAEGIARFFRALFI